MAATVPTSIRPAATSKASSASHTSRSNSKPSIVAPRPWATSMSGARKTSSQHGGVRAEHVGVRRPPKPMTSPSRRNCR